MRPTALVLLFLIWTKPAAAAAPEIISAMIGVQNIERHIAAGIKLGDRSEIEIQWTLLKSIGYPLLQLSSDGPLGSCPHAIALLHSLIFLSVNTMNADRLIRLEDAKRGYPLSAAQCEAQLGLSPTAPPNLR